MPRSDTLSRLFDRSVAVATDRQAWLQTRIGALDWAFDLASGTMTFTDPETGDQLVSPCQVLGTESEESNTWLWAWANDWSDLPLGLLTAARLMNTIGQEQQVPEFVTATMSLEHADGATMALIASAAYGGAGWYRAGYEGGALYVLLMAEELIEPPVPPMIRLGTGWAQTLAAVGEEITDQRDALRAYAVRLGLRPDDGTDTVRIRGAEGEASVMFDAEGRTTSIRVEAQPFGQ